VASGFFEIKIWAKLYHEYCRSIKKARMAIPASYPELNEVIVQVNNNLEQSNSRHLHDKDPPPTFPRASGMKCRLLILRVSLSRQTPIFEHQQEAISVSWSHRLTYSSAASRLFLPPAA